MPTYLSYFVGTFFVSLLGLSFLKKLRQSHSTKLKNRFLVFSGKSASGAQLLGGLPIALSYILGVTVTSLFSPQWPVNLYTLIPFICGSFIIISYGYLDDRFELRPIVKLVSQFLAVSIFSIFAAVQVGGSFSAVIFVVMFVYGMGSVNGTNLLDGLDTMTIKISSVVYLAYATMGILLNSDATTYYAFIGIGALLPFSFFNNFPSRMHLGEIGGAYIGFSYMLLFTCLFRDIANTHSLNDSLIYALLPLTISMGEVAISFSRRLLNGKSPFKGDRFHMHQIFKNYYNISVPMTTTLLGFVYGSFLFFSLGTSIIFKVPAIISYIGLILMIGGFQLYFGKKYWIKKGFNLGLKNLLKSLRKEELTIIDSSKVDNFQFKIIDGGKSVKVNYTVQDMNKAA